MYYDYKKDFLTSSNYQRLVMDFLREERGHIVVDLMEDREAQRQGIDFRVNGEDVEFKVDTRIADTGNLAIEIVSNLQRGSVGSILRSQAKWLFYYDPIGRVCHCMLLRGLIDAIHHSDNKIWSVAHARTLLDDGFYSSLSLLVPTSFVRRQRGVAYGRLDLSSYIQRRGNA